MNSIELAKIFNKQHTSILKVIVNIKQYLNSLELKKSNRGRYYTFNDIDRDFISLSLKGEKAMKFRILYIELKYSDDTPLNKLKKINSFFENRKYIFILTDELTDTIKKYVVDYRREVEHKMNDGRFYQHYTNLIYRTLDIELPRGKNPRDVLDIRKLVKVEDMELKVADLIKEFAEQGIHYKEVYKKIKKKLEKQ